MSRATRLRLFVACYPPGEVARGYLEAAGRLELPRHRLVPPEQVHLTLQFIGDTDPRELDRVAESVRRSASGLGRFTLEPVRLVSLPSGRRPRLVAAEMTAPPEVLELHRRLAHRLASKTRRGASDRFLPHLTLLRFAHGERPSRVEEPLQAEGFEVARVHLMRSVLLPQGAEHRCVEQVELGARGPG